MQPTFDDLEFCQALFNVVNAANDAGRDARRYGFDKGTQTRCREVFRLTRTVSKVIPAARNPKPTPNDNVKAESRKSTRTDHVYETQAAPAAGLGGPRRRARWAAATSQ